MTLTRRLATLTLLIILAGCQHDDRTMVATSADDGFDAWRNWLAGSWQATSDTATGSRWTEEHWRTTIDGSLIGFNWSNDRRTVDFQYELLAIVPRSDTDVSYVARPGGRGRGVEFTLRTDAPINELHFENAENDFPTLIKYIRQSDDAMVAEIWGPENDRELVKGASWTFTRLNDAPTTR